MPHNSTAAASSTALLPACAATSRWMSQAVATPPTCTARRVIRHPKHILPNRKCMMLAPLVHVVKPRPPAQMRVLSDRRMRHCQDPRPDANIATQIHCNRIPPPQQHIHWPDHQRGHQQNQRRIRRRKAGSHHPVFVRPRKINTRHHTCAEHKQRQMMLDEAAAKTTIPGLVQLVTGRKRHLFLGYLHRPAFSPKPAALTISLISRRITSPAVSSVASKIPNAWHPFHKLNESPGPKPLAGSLLPLLRWWLNCGVKESPAEMNALFHCMVWNELK
jgi:hypothetical protein